MHGRGQVCNPTTSILAFRLDILHTITDTSSNLRSKASKAERELQSNLRIQRREFLHSSENAKISHSELQHILDLERHQITSKPTPIGFHFGCDAQPESAEADVA